MAGNWSASDIKTMIKTPARWESAAGETCDRWIEIDDARLLKRGLGLYGEDYPFFV